MPGRLGRLATEGGLQLPIGEALVAAGVIDPPLLQNALALQARWRSRLGDVVLAQRGVAPLRFYTVLAQHFGLNFVNLLKQPIDPALFQPERLADYAQRLVLPWREEDGQLVLAVADPGPEIFAWARATYGEQVRFVGTSKFDIVWSLQQHADAQLTHDALNLLAEHAPEHSARQVITRAQSAFLVALTVVLAAALALWPLVTLIALNTLIAVAFLATFGLKLVLAWRGARRRIDIKVSDEEVAALGDEDLPVYTVLVPMYKEPDVLPILANALRRLDYPTSKLDVKLVLEADDTETIEAAKALGLEAFFEIIRVPPSQPKTKPKACNYALRFARGQMLTIYDAEDKPEPDQLKRVVAAFRKSPADVACIQARLNYYNADENWLTRMFTLEYTLWFDFYLPALETLRIPIPLGGTSNHFRLDILRKVHAWDPYNVTEDADLGVRLTQQGYRVSVVNSTTFEEANVSIPNWIRQRSRWLKGYMQTWLVHMRNPLQLYRSTGARGFWGFQLFVGGTFFTALAAPLMWLSYGLWLAVGSKFFDPFFPPALLYLSLLNLLLGNGFLIYMTLVAAFKRDYFRLAPYALTVPLYWLLQSIAAYKGLWQLIRNPFYWEKTTHGISKHMAEERRAALDD
ncbi:glycosyltransferase family 2 protein [Xanthomonas rydalmerensis]|uniref:Glycosyltransferase family 2 protein n=1 Tax=Xanthomonas rydalmerensis TaxID=3046274 RepID=A0ABZ0JVP9_9XANT|nr:MULTISPECIES: glycosyltransferase family 2 protein [unclassified Xanthomonas]WOS43049.1 glycosyltransferase family 2 protein [Xanthomonas sp. DM-2023]WOS47231.1 glycosyltransferase family 2 protein [Xanthomonas sp. DM-2023]WOS51411.1 glycosyltransferase family 2 protein [Xanthomonas sp. DM-2023]WOS55594.1 glycosyltransferase family 2 protein [Xanthomonas sp. DM-2023]WOS59774.1 glycosyltransferase family 2 protein [Xanthomonas sp. DM-2023]